MNHLDSTSMLYVKFACKNYAHKCNALYMESAQSECCTPEANFQLLIKAVLKKLKTSELVSFFVENFEMRGDF